MVKQSAVYCTEACIRKRAGSFRRKSAFSARPNVVRSRSKTSLTDLLPIWMVRSFCNHRQGRRGIQEKLKVTNQEDVSSVYTQRGKWVAIDQNVAGIPQGFESDQAPVREQGDMVWLHGRMGDSEAAGRVRSEDKGLVAVKTFLEACSACQPQSRGLCRCGLRHLRKYRREELACCPITSVKHHLCCILMHPHGKTSQSSAARFMSLFSGVTISVEPMARG